MRKHIIKGLQTSELFLIVLYLAAAIFIFQIAESRIVFSYEHDWVSAHFAVMARNFANIGILNLGGLPLQNNLPLTSEPDYYLNWPPLFPIILSYVIKIIGDVEQNMHLFMAIITIVNSLAISYAVYLIYGRIPALITAISYLVVPVTVKYGTSVIHLHVAMLFTVLSLLFWLLWMKSAEKNEGNKLLITFGAFFLSLAVFTSWEPLLLLPGLMVAVFACKNNFRMNMRAAIIYSIAAIAALTFVFSLYLIQEDWAREQIMQRVIAYSGWVKYSVETPRIHGLVEVLLGSNPFSMRQFLNRAAGTVGFVGFFPVIALFTMIFLTCCRSKYINRYDYFLILPLFGIALIWSLAMNNHFVIHEYEAINVTAVAAASLGIVTAKLMHKKYIGAILPVLLILSTSVSGIYIFKKNNMSFAEDHSHDYLVRMGGFIKENTLASDIILSDNPSMVPVYYSNRHVIRMISHTNPQIILDHGSAIRKLCDECAIYLVGSGGYIKNAGKIIAGGEVSQRDDFSIYRIAGPAEEIKRQK